MGTCDDRVESAVDAVMVKPRRARYRRMVLVSVPRHLRDFDPTEPDMLVVCTEWLVWHEARQAGFDAVHYECADPIWPTIDAGPPLDLPMSGSAWIWMDGRDPTVYRGVSMGRLCSVYFGLTWHSSATIRHGLLTLCRDYRPEVIVLCDLSSPYDALVPEAKRALAADVAATIGAQLDDRLDPPTPDEHALPFLQGCIAPTARQPPKLRDRLRDWASLAVEMLYRLRLAARWRRPRVFFYISLLSLRQLVGAFDGRAVVPMFPFGASPKDRDFLSQCWRSGIWPVAMPLPGSDGRRRSEANRLIATVESHWASHPPEGGLNAVHRESIRAVLLRPEVLISLMEMVDRLAHLLDRLKVDRVVTGDSASPLGRAMCELAAARGIPADETLNGVFALPQRNAPRCGDRSVPPTVTRELAMGPAAEDWLDAQGSPIDRIVTGYPALGQPQPGPLASPKLRHALVLPGYAFGNDIEATRSRIISSTIETVRMLKDLGFTGIRLKLHPSKDVVAFYRDLVERLNLPCEVHGASPFQQHLAWTDIVVGPTGTSTFLETLAGGKPYYIMRPRPSSIPDSLLPGAVVVADAAELAAALKAGIVPDRDRLLGYWCGLGQVANPLAATWDAIISATEARSRRPG